MLPDLLKLMTMTVAVAHGAGVSAALDLIAVSLTRSLAQESTPFSPIAKLQQAEQEQLAQGLAPMAAHEPATTSIVAAPASATSVPAGPSRAAQSFDALRDRSGHDEGHAPVTRSGRTRPTQMTSNDNEHTTSFAAPPERTASPSASQTNTKPAEPSTASMHAAPADVARSVFATHAPKGTNMHPAHALATTEPVSLAGVKAERNRALKTKTPETEKEGPTRQVGYESQTTGTHICARV